ncbi:hypothetical protein [Anaerostipes faecalis]|uniref:hypothetical protein n=1 Tax=Anaerostipes faecalis TaxID=2738446 RepID=UPI001C1E652D|nr:hypothetical protein [Anaerostipes faecalis]
MFEDNICPMLKSDAVKKYNLTDDFIKKFCNKGCSVKCGEFLEEELDKIGLLQVEGQMEFNFVKKC